jgi:hypothetical protein
MLHFQSIQVAISPKQQWFKRRMGLERYIYIFWWLRNSAEFHFKIHSQVINHFCGIGTWKEITCRPTRWDNSREEKWQRLTFSKCFRSNSSLFQKYKYYCFWTLSIVLSLSKNIALFIFSKHNVSETGFCLRLQVKPTQLIPIDIASPLSPRTPKRSKIVTQCAHLQLVANTVRAEQCSTPLGTLYPHPMSWHLSNADVQHKLTVFQHSCLLCALILCICPPYWFTWTFLHGGYHNVHKETHAFTIKVQSVCSCWVEI